MTSERRVALLAAVGLAACLGAYYGLRGARPAPPAAAPEPAIAAPAPSQPALPGAPLEEDGTVKPVVTNEQIQDDLDRQSEKLGIKATGRGLADDGEEGPQDTSLFQPGEPGSRERVEEYVRHLAAMRKIVQGPRGTTIQLKGETAPVLAQPSQSRPIEAGTDERPSEGPGSETREVIRHKDGSWSGSFGGPETGQLVIRDPKVFAQLWSMVSRDPAPAVDFSKEMVAAVLVGMRPTGGYQVRILEVASRPDVVTVRWRETPPVAGKTPPDEKTAPFALKVIPASDIAVRFLRVQ